MIRVIFKNLDQSELATEACVERIKTIVEKFNLLKKSRINVTLEMENSPTKAGPDVFNVKVQVCGGRYDGVRVEKSASSLYVALADVVGHMLETLNRFSDKIRVKQRGKARKFASNVLYGLRTSS
jgi:ribosome-associated translation inhibitor RaiA